MESIFWYFKYYVQVSNTFGNLFPMLLLAIVHSRSLFFYINFDLYRFQFGKYYHLPGFLY